MNDGGGAPPTHDTPPPASAANPLAALPRTSEPEAGCPIRAHLSAAAQVPRPRRAATKPGPVGERVCDLEA